MHSLLGSLGNFGNAQTWRPDEAQKGSQPPARHGTQAESPRSQDTNMEEEGLTKKIRLNVPEHFDVGIVCMPNIMRDFTLTNMQPVSKDKNAVTNVESNLESWKATGVGRNKQVENREFRTRPGNVDTSCYFMLIEREGENSSMIVPVSKYLTVDPVVAMKTGNRTPEMRTEANDHVVDERLERIVKTEGVKSMIDRKNGQQIGHGLNNYTKRTANISWDFDGAPSDDEELYPQVEHDEDDDPLNQPHLTVYGHKMKSLLQQQMEREVDEELQEYSDDDEGSHVSAPGKHQRGPEAPDAQTSKKHKTEEEKSHDMDERVMRYLRQNNGKVPVKGVLSHFNITAKNEEFRLIQNVIQKRCIMSTEDKDGAKIKVISLKPEFREHLSTRGDKKVFDMAARNPGPIILDPPFGFPSFKNWVQRDALSRRLFRESEVNTRVYKVVYRNMGLKGHIPIDNKVGLYRIRMRCIFGGYGHGVFRFTRMSKMAFQQVAREGWLRRYGYRPDIFR